MLSIICATETKYLIEAIGEADGQTGTIGDGRAVDNNAYHTRSADVTSETFTAAPEGGAKAYMRSTRAPAR